MLSGFGQLSSMSAFSSELAIHTHRELWLRPSQTVSNECKIITKTKLLTTDLLALASMKNAAKCDK